METDPQPLQMVKLIINSSPAIRTLNVSTLTKEVNIFQVDSEQNNTTIYSCTHFNAFGFFKKISLSKSNNVSPEIENILDQS